MFKIAWFCLLLIAVLVVAMAVSVLAQPSASGGASGTPGAKPAPGAPMGGPGSGPPGMAIPKDVVHSGTPPKPTNVAGTSKAIGIVAGGIVVVVILVWVFGRKKKA